MSRIIHLFENPERFIVGTVGEPGDRTFFVQAKAGRRLISVAVEKSQVLALAERINYLVREIKKTNPELLRNKQPIDDKPMEAPIMEEFVVGIIGLVWLADRELISMDFQAFDQSLITDDGTEVELLGEEDEGPDLLRLVITPGSAEIFADRALKVVNAGRPPCIFCGLPLDARGHVCPRANGYRR